MAISQSEPRRISCAYQQCLTKALEGIEKLLEALSPDKKEEIMAKARSTIQLSLADSVLREVMGEKTSDSL
ncbi:unnamed protein product [Sphenostylis stenocarpa]|uniref:Uncharacterized protein n=1 Tax=Sphenostylis stenocarpa TaxID=92480 RepID=A0AA86VDT2_9FABA|nr:unnamed protein product [Sphenostylis stenocarpa]